MKLIILFTTFIFFLALRLYLYFDFKLELLIYKKSNVSVFSPIPFYVTEIIITLLCSYLMLSVSQNDTGSRQTIHVQAANRETIIIDDDDDNPVDSNDSLKT